MSFVNTATGIVIPNVGDPGKPAYQQISTALNSLCNLTHTGPANNDGYQLTQLSLNFTGDLPLNQNNLIAVRSTRMVDEAAILAGSSDTNCLYVVDGNLYYNNASGVPIELTNGPSPSANPVSVFAGESVTGNLVILPSNTANLFNVHSASGSIAITLPAAASVAPWRFYWFYDADNDAFNNNIFINIAGGSGNTIHAMNQTGGHDIPLASNGMSCVVYTDGVSTWYASVFNQYTYSGQTIVYNQASNVVLETGSLLALQDSQLTMDSTSSQVISGGTLHLQAPSTLITDAGVTTTINSSPVVGGNTVFNGTLTANTNIVINGILSSTAGSVFGYSFANITLPSSGTYTLSSIQYNCVVLINVGSLSLSNPLTIVFPEVTGFWILQTAGLALNGHTLTISQATSGDTSPLTSVGIFTFVVSQASGGILAGSTN